MRSIIDEAHQLPDLVSEFFGVALSSRQLEVLAADLRAELRARAANTTWGRSCWCRWNALRLPASRRSAAASGTSPGERCRRSPVPRSRNWRTPWLQCGEGLRALQGSPAIDQCAARVAAVAAALTTLLDESSGAESSTGARTASVHARGFLLRLLPYDVSGRFSALLHGASRCLDLHVRDSRRRRGLRPLRQPSGPAAGRDRALRKSVRLPAPGTAVSAAAAAGSCQRRIYGRRGRYGAAADRGGAGRRAFLLFTSHRALRAAAALLERQPAGRWPLLVQGTAPREQLLRRFRASGRAVLLGTASFWEGVDVQGDALRLVIIDKLPFTSPEDPVVRARIEHLESQGAGAFREYQLPEAVLALKQGVGRLIRSERIAAWSWCAIRACRAAVTAAFSSSSLPRMALVTELAPVLSLLRELACSAEAASAAERPAVPA